MIIVCKIQEIRFKLIDKDAYRELNTEDELDLAESFASEKKGTLNPIEDETSYADYRINVKQAGDYTIFACICLFKQRARRIAAGKNCFIFSIIAFA